MSTEKNNAEILSENAIQAFFNNTENTVEPPKEPEQQVEVDAFFNNTDTPPAKEEVQVPAKEVVNDKNFYHDIIKEYIEDGEWEDGEVQLTEDSEPILLSELKDVTPELFKELRRQQKELKEEKFKSDYISVQGLDETTKELIRLKKAGGDITPLLEVETKHVNPLLNLDIEDEKVQEWLLVQKYQSQGIEPEFIEARINKFKENLQLDLEAKKIAQEVKSNYENLVKAETEKQEAINKEIQEEQKKFRKTMTDTFRGMGLQKETLVKNLVDYTSKYDEQGLTEADRLYFGAKENPELFAEVVFLLSNKEAYNEFKGVKIKNTVAKETVQKIFKITPKASSSPANTPKDAVQEFFST